MNQKLKAIADTLDRIASSIRDINRNPNLTQKNRAFLLSKIRWEMNAQGQALSSVASSYDRQEQPKAPC